YQQVYGYGQQGQGGRRQQQQGPSNGQPAQNQSQNQQQQQAYQYNQPSYTPSSDNARGSNLPNFNTYISGQSANSPSTTTRNLNEMSTGNNNPSDASPHMAFNKPKDTSLLAQQYPYSSIRSSNGPPNAGAQSSPNQRNAFRNNTNASPTMSANANATAYRNTRSPAASPTTTQSQQQGSYSSNSHFNSVSIWKVACRERVVKFNF
ncbi:hypothetical protein HMPREF1544_03672, partial [Mucor circinelloides 1006PhL]